MAAKQQSSADQLFTRDDYDQLRLHRRRLNDLLQRIDKATACGVACDFIKSQRDEADAQLAAIEQYFMTPTPGK